MNNFKIDFQLTQKDICDSNIAIISENFRKPTVIAGLVFIELLAIAGAIGYLFTPKPDGSNISLIAASIACAFVFPGIVLFLGYLNPRRAAKSLYKKNANLQNSVSWSFSEDLITSQMATGKSELLWSTFIKARETTDLFLLYPQKQLAFPIPKRAFANEGEMSAFRELIVRHIQDTAKMRTQRTQ